MKNPYEVLGVSPNSTDEQIKAAYKDLARKYHPDNYANNPLSDLAEEKMKEINEAYDTIMSERRNKGGFGNNQNYSGGFNSNSGSGEFADIRSLIMQNRLEEAQELLDGVDVSRRTAEWYFLSGNVLYRRGWYDDAYSAFSTACNMDPSNAEYRQAFNRMAQARQGSFGGGYRQNNGSDCDCCDLCATLWCANLCCNCMR